MSHSDFHIPNGFGRPAPGALLGALSLCCLLGGLDKRGTAFEGDLVSGRGRGGTLLQRVRGGTGSAAAGRAHRGLPSHPFPGFAIASPDRHRRLSIVHGRTPGRRQHLGVRFTEVSRALPGPFLPRRNEVHCNGVPVSVLLPILRLEHGPHICGQFVRYGGGCWHFRKSHHTAVGAGSRGAIAHVCHGCRFGH
jgi:hypothetical protein